MSEKDQIGREQPLRTLIQDIKFAFRMLVKSPVFTIAAVLCLGLGIGANGTILPFFYGIIVNPLPYEEQDRLVFIQETAHAQGFNRISVSYPDFADWRDQNQVFSGMASFRWTNRTLTGLGEPEMLAGAAVTYNLPELLGREPIAGRSFSREEDEPGAEGVVLIGEGLWQRHFGSNPDLLGQTLMIGGESRTVIGIMPHEFRFPETSEFWVPMRENPAVGRGNHNCSAIARLKPGVMLDQARADMDAIAARLAQEYPDSNTGVGIYMVALKEWFNEGESDAALIFYCVVCFILLLACANVANLLLARSAARRQEIAVRATLGAGRGRIVRQLITESILLAMTGGILGFILAVVGRNLTLVNIPVEIPAYLNFDMNFTVIVSLILITALCGVLFGLAPAIESANANLADTLRSGSGKTSGGIRKSRFRSFLVGLEVTLALTVLVGACLMMKGFMRLKAVDIGFESENMLTIDISLSGEKYSEGQPRVIFFRDLLERIRSLPGVSNASLVSDLPDGYVGWSRGVYVEGTEPAQPGQNPFTTHVVSAPGYFNTMRIPLLRGRDFNESDVAEGAPMAVVVNEAFVEYYWSDSDPLGRRICYGDEPTDDEAGWMQVVGVVGDTHNSGYGNTVRPGIYRPHAQYAVSDMMLTVKTLSDPLGIVDSIRSEVWSLDPDLPLAYIRTMDRVILESNWGQHLFTWLFGVFSFIALVLASVGVYGVVAYSVSQRSREFGIRMALGAGPGRVTRLVVRQGFALAGIGLIAGLIIALLVMRYVSSIMFGVSPTDPVVYGTATVTMGVVAVLASYIPARRATRVDPVDALRNE